MRAIIVRHPGGPEALEWAEIDEPAPAPGEVLVQTAAAGVNFIEIYEREGVYARTLPFVPGTEGAGTVVAVGAGVTSLAAGDRVASTLARGTYAERFVVAADAAVRVPETVDLETAAAVALQGCTAHYLTTSAASPQPGDTVLVHAGAGGVGLLLTQLLAARGVRVLTTASTDEKRALSLAAGAAASLPYDGFAEAVRELTGGAGVAVAYDGVGRTTFDGSLRALRVRGEMVLFGAASGQVPPFELQRLNTGGSLSITRPSLPHFMRTPDERGWRFGEVFQALESGALSLRIGERFALAAAADAHRALAGRGTTGKLILVP